MNGSRPGNLFLAVVDQTSRAAELIAVVLLYGFGGLMLAEVVARGFLGASLPFSWEYSTYAMAGVFFLGFGAALRNGTHVRVSLLLERGGPVVTRRIDMFATGVALVIALIIAHACLTLVLNSSARGLRAPSVTATPLVIPQSFALLGAMQLVLDLLARLLRLHRRAPLVPVDGDGDPTPAPDDGAMGSGSGSGSGSGAGAGAAANAPIVADTHER